MVNQKVVKKTEPAHSFLYEPSDLAPVTNSPDPVSLLSMTELSLVQPFNDRQAQAFSKSFTHRLSLLWGPPGTGKTTVLAGIILGWLEMADKTGIPVCIAIGSSNWNAIDNVLSSVGNLLEHRTKQVGEFSLPVWLTRVRGDHSPPPTDNRVMDIQRRSIMASEMTKHLSSSDRCIIVGSTWMQLSKMAEDSSLEDRRPVAKWFDLILIDEASQVPVSTAAAYFLLGKETANLYSQVIIDSLALSMAFRCKTVIKGFSIVFFRICENTIISNRQHLIAIIEQILRFLVGQRNGFIQRDMRHFIQNGVLTLPYQSSMLLPQLVGQRRCLGVPSCFASLILIYPL